MLLALMIGDFLPMLASIVVHAVILVSPELT